MKKVLFASTALIATAGVASADIAVTGGANMGVDYGVSVVDDLAVKNEIDFNIVGSGETDGGISFGASVDLDAHSNGSATTTSDVGDPEVFVSYNGLKLSVGAIDSAADQGGLADIGFDGIGIDDVAEITSLGSHDVRVDYSFGDVSVAASIDSDGANDDWGLGLSTSFDAITVALGVAETGGADQVRLTVGYSAGAFGAKAYYNENGAADAFGIEGSYTSGDVTVTAVFSDAGAAGDAYGIGVAYDLGGATLAGGFGQNAADNTVADLGISFSF